MKYNPFIEDNQDPEGSFRERLEICHALRQDTAASPDVDKEWKLFCEENGISNSVSKRKHLSGKRIFLYLGRLGAACLVLLLWLFVSNEKNNDSGMPSPAALVSDQKKNVILQDTVKEFSTQKQTKAITKVAPREIIPMVEEEWVMTLISKTAPGEEMTILLPDSSKVMLWANSKLEYPEEFKGNTREVTLEGMAYFDVSKNDKLFIVHAGSIDAVVHGTQFCIQSDSEGEASVSLVAGSVSVGSPNTGNEVTLVPGEESVCSNGNMDIREFDIYSMQQWKEGMFYFRTETLINIIKKIASWHNIPVAANNMSCLNERIHFVAERDCPLAEIIESLSEVTSAEINFDGLKITIE